VSAAAIPAGPVGAAVAEAAPADLAHFRKRRGAELGLLLFALVITAAAYAIIDASILGHIEQRSIAAVAIFTLLAIAAHITVRLRAAYADPVLLPCVVFLNGLGLAIIHRLDLASAAAAAASGASPPRMDALLQLTWTTLAVIAFVAVLIFLRDHRLLQRVTYTAGLLGVILLLLPLIPGLGVEILGARIWIRLGPLSFQPAEVAKVAMIIFFAGYLVTKRDALALAGRRVLGLDLPRARDLAPLLLGWLISLGVLVFERDLGTSLLFFGAFVVLLYVATQRPGWLVLGTILFALGTMFGYSAFGHVRIRFSAWLHPFADTDGSYQIIQSLYGLAYGGILGTGLGQGRPSLIPLAKSDFIAAGVGEELGVTGFMALIVVYALVVERALRTSLLCRDPYGKLLAIGFGTVFALQVFVVIGGVTKLIPLTGLTTPFMSQGGSSLLANWALVALLLRVSHHARQPRPAPSVPVSSETSETSSFAPIPGIEPPEDRAQDYQAQDDQNTQAVPL
jgi:cell division protein FtsW (lipid II flippase)